MSEETKRLTCLHCRREFEVPKARGLYPMHCGRPECEADRAQKRAADRAAAAAERRVERQRRKLGRQKAIAALAPLIDSEGGRLCAAELAELGHLLDRVELDGVDRPQIRAAVVRLAHARGLDETRQRALELAAVCITSAAASVSVERQQLERA